jgi:hypothetical protein
VARVLVNKHSPATLSFNYRSVDNAIWALPQLQERWEYEAVYPLEGASGLRVELDVPSVPMCFRLDRHSGLVFERGDAYDAETRRPRLVRWS